jgi:hypothetical protein
MAAYSTSASLSRPARRTFPATAAKHATLRLLRAMHDLWDGSSWEAGRDSLTRVHSPSERQEPR